MSISIDRISFVPGPGCCCFAGEGTAASTRPIRRTTTATARMRISPELWSLLEPGETERVAPLEEEPDGHEHAVLHRPDGACGVLDVDAVSPGAATDPD